MKRWFFFLIFTACATRGQVMTVPAFQSTPVGTTEAHLVKTYGKPLTIYHKANGDAIYEYIERLQLSNGVTMEAHRYYFTIRDQKVIHKQMWTINQPAYDLNNDISDL